LGIIHKLWLCTIWTRPDAAWPSSHRRNLGDAPKRAGPNPKGNVFTNGSSIRVEGWASAAS
jgi:hypothetical protein